MRSKFLTIAFIITLILFILSFSIGLPIYFRFFYYLQIGPLGLENVYIESVNRSLTRSEIITAYNDLLNYLVLGSKFKTGVLAYSDSEVAHFEDVKQLFTLNLIILVFSTAFLFAIREITKKDSSIKLYRFKRTPFFYAGAILLSITLLIIVIVSIDFYRAFIFFHDIFFPNKTNYFFGPDEEIIYLLPQQFFVNCAILIGVSIILLSIGCLVIDFLVKRKEDKAGIKLVAIDIDGTLLNSNRELTNKTIEEIKKASEKGVSIVIASGRPFQGIIPLLERLNLVNENNYTICFNGASIINNKSQESIFNYPICKESILELHDLAKINNIHTQTFVDGQCYSEYHNKYSKIEEELNKITLTIMDYKDLEDNCLVNKFMWSDEPEKLAVAYLKIPKEIFSKYNVVYSTPYFLEFLNPVASKGKALEQLANLLGLAYYEVMAIGDEENDLSMLKYAKVKVAMGNAVPKVKKVANYVTLSNNEDGVANAIRVFINKEDEQNGNHKEF